MNSENKTLTINDVQKDALRSMAKMLFEDKSFAQIKDMLGIMSLTALDAIASKRGLEHPKDHSVLAVEIVHGIEFWLEDFIAYEMDMEYGPDEEEKNVSAE